MAVYNGVAVLVTFLLPVLARAVGRVRTHVACLVIGGLGLMSMYVFRDPTMLLISLTAGWHPVGGPPPAAPSILHLGPSSPDKGGLPRGLYLVSGNSATRCCCPPPP